MNLVLAPVLTPMMTAMICAAATSRPQLQKLLSLAGAALQLAAALLLLLEVNRVGTLSLAAGNWDQPFAIVLIADPLGAALVLLAAWMLVVVLLWTYSDADSAPPSPVLWPLIHGLVAGACAAFLAADYFNLYVWFEVALICSLGLLALGGRLRQLDATLKYFAINFVGTLVLLIAVSLVYARSGQLNFVALGEAFTTGDSFLWLPIIGLLAIAFLIKAAAFPFFAWLPASYHTLPAPVLALFSAILSKIGVCAMLRLFGDVFAPAPSFLLTFLGWLALLSMVLGVMGAAYHYDMRRILAFHSVSQIGYILLAISLATPAGNTAAIFFTLHHSLVKPSLFLLAALIFRLTGYYDLRRIGGLYTSRPLLATLFLVFALALVGIPPSSGFWGKFLIIRACLLQGEYIWAATALLVGALTFYSMLKIWMEAFWKDHPDPDWSPPRASLRTAYAGIGLLCIVVVSIGLNPEPLISFVTTAAQSLNGGLP